MCCSVNDFKEFMHENEGGLQQLLTFTAYCLNK